MDSYKFLITALLLIFSMQSLALYSSAGDQVNRDESVVSNMWVAEFYSAER